MTKNADNESYVNTATQLNNKAAFTTCIISLVVALVGVGAGVMSSLPVKMKYATVQIDVGGDFKNIALLSGDNLNVERILVDNNPGVRLRIITFQKAGNLAYNLNPIDLYREHARTRAALQSTIRPRSGSQFDRQNKKGEGIYAGE